MPYIRSGDISIYYEIHGSGSQMLIMIRGLGADVTAWFSQIPELSKHFRLIVFDNRGAGRTDKPDAPYSTAQMAADTKGLLDALDISQTSLLGLSMGGMIAQEFAIHYPERVDRLVLGCTTFGGRDSIAPAAEVFAALQERTLFTDETIANNRSAITAYNEAKRKFPIPPFAFQRQLEAITRHDTANRLGQITAPTLVMTGREDRLIPPENSRLLAARIPGAVLKELPGGHLFALEHPDLFNKAVFEFLMQPPLIT
jgi:3-oxoadipate enol-lactonase